MSEAAGTISEPPAPPLRRLTTHLVPLHLQPEERVILQELSFQSHKVLELQTGDGVEEGPSKEQDVLGRSHPQGAVLQWNSEREVLLKLC